MVTQTVLAGKDVGLVVIVRCQMMKCYKKVLRSYLLCIVK